VKFHGFYLFADIKANMIEPEYLLNARIIPQINTQAKIDEAYSKAFAI
jgi:hypothetical protein